MPDTTERQRRSGEDRSIRSRLGWFLLLWLSGLAAVGLLAAGLRALMNLTMQ